MRARNDLKLLLVAYAVGALLLGIEGALVTLLHEPSQVAESEPADVINLGELPPVPDSPRPGIYCVTFSLERPVDRAGQVTAFDSDCRLETSI